MWTSKFSNVTVKPLVKSFLLVKVLNYILVQLGYFNIIWKDKERKNFCTRQNGELNRYRIMINNKGFMSVKLEEQEKQK